jgi:hypothetical protein
VALIERDGFNFKNQFIKTQLRKICCKCSFKKSITIKILERVVWKAKQKTL